jgi:hypothetical protein
VQTSVAPLVSSARVTDTPLGGECARLSRSAARGLPIGNGAALI